MKRGLLASLIFGIAIIIASITVAVFSVSNHSHHVAVVAGTAFVATQRQGSSINSLKKEIVQVKTGHATYEQHITKITKIAKLVVTADTTKMQGQVDALNQEITQLNQQLDSSAKLQTVCQFSLERSYIDNQFINHFIEDYYQAFKTTKSSWAYNMHRDLMRYQYQLILLQHKRDSIC